MNPIDKIKREPLMMIGAPLLILAVVALIRWAPLDEDTKSTAAGGAIFVALALLRQLVTPVAAPSLPPSGAP